MAHGGAIFKCFLRCVYWQAELEPYTLSQPAPLHYTPFITNSILPSQTWAKSKQMLQCVHWRMASDLSMDKSQDKSQLVAVMVDQWTVIKSITFLLALFVFWLTLSVCVSFRVHPGPGPFTADMCRAEFLSKDTTGLGETAIPSEPSRPANTVWPHWR